MYLPRPATPAQARALQQRDLYDDAHDTTVLGMKAIIGIVVACVVLTVLCAAVFWCCVIKSRRNARERTEQMNKEMQASYNRSANPPAGSYEMNNTNKNTSTAAAAPPPPPAYYPSTHTT